MEEMVLTAREQTGHLLRRFGLGASASELERYERLGVNKTIDALIDFESTPASPQISPWEFMFQEKQQIQLDPGRIVRWWVLQMLVTTRPSQEKLALFWHNHFAVSGAKVESGPLMLGYLQTLRANTNGSFQTLLKAISKDAAMLRWLDTDTSIKGQPNENFAREVMELFTLGIGNYTEKDVQEAARAFTGWSIRSIYRGGRPPEQRAQIRESIIYRRPLYASSYSEGLHDDGPKTILGKTAKFDTDSLLEMLASRPETARYLATKLWSFFAYPNPEPKIVDRLAKIYLDNKTDIRPVLLAIANHKEFWSERAYRNQVKSPLDFSLAFTRQLELRESILALRDPKAAPTTPMPGPIVAVTDMVVSAMRKQGMVLLYPPDVAGWDWGTAWVSPAMMLERIKFAGQVFGRGRAQQILSTLAKQIAPEGIAVTTSSQVVDLLMTLFDGVADPAKKGLLIEAFESAGGVAAMQKPATSAQLLGGFARVLFAMPEYQFC